MNRLADVPRDLLDQVRSVVLEILTAAPGLSSADLMVVGAQARDIHHHALGHTFATTTTSDLDLGVALADWGAFRAVAAAFRRVGDTGIRFLIAGTAVDIMPFGAVEDPAGRSRPATRGADLSVWAFDAVHDRALDLQLPDSVSVTIPTVAGYAALKLCAWLDRREFKDAADLALVLWWYCKSAGVRDLLYSPGDGEDLLVEEGFDLDAAAVRQLGRDAAVTIGPDYVAALLDRRQGPADVTLVRELRLPARSWPAESARRADLLRSLARGIGDRR